MAAAGTGIGTAGTVWAKFLKPRRDARKQAKEDAIKARDKKFFDAIADLRAENNQQHAEGLMEARQTATTLARMESKQDHLVEKVDKIEDDVANVRERTAYLEGHVGHHI